jgi:ankyrin repeat protein
MLAIMNASYDLAATLIEWGADASDNSEGFGVLHQLIWTAIPHNPGIYPPPPQMHGRKNTLTALDMVKILADAGANPNEPETDLSPFSYKMGQLGDISGITPLMLAARMQDVDLMKALLAAGADGKVMTWNGTTLLMVAAGLTSWEGEMPAFKPGSYLATLKLAYEVCGCDVNHQNDNGWTAVHAAVYNRTNDGIRWLASQGARFDIKTYFDDLSFPWRGPGKTPLRLAEGQYQAMVYRYFCEQQPVLREVMGLPPSECVRIVEGETEATLGGGR